MPTASLAGVLLLVALVPGHVFIRFTEAKRSSRGDVSAFQEILETVAAGLATTLPVIAIFSLICAADVVDLLAATADQKLVTEHLVRVGVWTLTGVVAASVVLALVAAALINGCSTTASDKFAWRDVLKTGLPKILPKLHGQDFNTVVTIELRDGRTIDGLLRTFDTIPAGGGRDIGLQAPIYVKGRTFDRQELTSADGMLIAESQIELLTVRFDPK